MMTITTYNKKEMVTHEIAHANLKLLLGKNGRLGQTVSG
jgi:hypothetical protein